MTIQIRQLEAADQPAVRIAGEALAARYYPELIPAIDREHAMLTSFRSDPKQYCRVVGPTGDPDAALIASAGDNLWALRRHATVLLWYSKRPRAGYALLRDFRNWTLGQKHVVLAGFMDDFDMDVRMVALLKRAGFIKRGGAYVFFPRTKQ